MDRGFDSAQLAEPEKIVPSRARFFRVKRSGSRAVAAQHFVLLKQPRDGAKILGTPAGPEPARESAEKVREVPARLRLGKLFPQVCFDEIVKIRNHERVPICPASQEREAHVEGSGQPVQ